MLNCFVRRGGKCSAKIAAAQSLDRSLLQLVARMHVTLRGFGRRVPAIPLTVHKSVRVSTKRLSAVCRRS